MSNDTLVRNAKSTIQRAVDKYKINALVSLFSGGEDSMLVTHIASQHSLFVGCIHIDTKTSPLSQIASNEAITKMDAMEWDYIVESPFTTFAQLIAKYGMPGPSTHNMTYQYLKGRPIDEAKKAWNARLTQQWSDQNSQHWGQKPRIGFITGIRADESSRRAKVLLAVKLRGTAWISPILPFSRADRAEYLTRNGVNQIYKSSRDGLGECNCGAFAKPGEADIKDTFFMMREYREKLEELARVARELQLIEVRAGMRSESAVIKQAHTRWGHGAVSGKDTTLKDIVSICNDCEGQLTYDGTQVGEDMEYISALRVAISDLAAHS